MNMQKFFFLEQLLIRYLYGKWMYLNFSYECKKKIKIYMSNFSSEIIE